MRVCVCVCVCVCACVRVCACVCQCNGGCVEKSCYLKGLRRQRKRSECGEGNGQIL
jgi:hypothetical protein